MVSERESCVDVLMVRDRALIYAKSFADAQEAIDALSPGGHLAELQGAFFEGEKAARLVLYGASDVENWQRRLSPEFQEIKSGDLFAGLKDHASIPAFGLSLKGIRPVPVQMNLMPAGLRKKPNRTGFYVMMVLALLVIVSGVLWAGSLWLNQRQMMKALEAESVRLKTQVSVVEQMVDENRKIREDLAYLRSIRPGNAYLIEIINELSVIMPQTAYITDFKLNGNKLGLYGMADSASELISILEESPLFMDVAFLSAIRNSRDGKEIFRIGCNLQTKK
jgi:Tfp pilus assembly protein PilN